MSSDLRRIAEERMARAKASYTRAARAALEGLPLAVAMTETALAEVEAAREELRALDTKENGMPDGQGRGAAAAWRSVGRDAHPPADHAGFFIHERPHARS